MYDLSVLIPARNEMFLAKTVEELLKNKRGKTEVIVVLDGEWAFPAIEDHPDLTVIFNPEAVGQRGATNQACRLSTAKYVMKLDAHCILDEGFDVKMIEAFESLPDGESVTMLPALYNLHAFDWVCIGKLNKSDLPYEEEFSELHKSQGCGHTIYQGPTPEKCPTCGGNMERQLVWKPRLNKRSEFFRFDTSLHFQYHGIRGKHPEAQGRIAETMSAQGSCFMLTRKKYWELNISDEKFGSWGQQGVEVSCKTWLSGGRLVTNKDTFYAHLFRTQGGDFGFPYPLSGKQVDAARKFSRELFVENTWPLQIHPLSWLIAKFAPLEDKDPKKQPDWHTEKGKEMLDLVNKKGEEFYNREIKKVKAGLEEAGKNLDKIFNETFGKGPSKGMVYYTDNQLNIKLATAVKKQLTRISFDRQMPIVSASLKPLTNFGKNIVLPNLKRGYEAYFRQILAALEASDADIIFFTEHDWYYHPSHFDFTPKEKDTFYYNWNWWRVRAADGHAVHYDTQLLPGMVAYREPLIKHYKNLIKYLEQVGFTSENANRVGFEPGTNKRVDLGRAKIERFDSRFPLIDIRHGNNLTASKWSADEFRNPKNAKGWVEKKAWDIPGWKFNKKPFDITSGKPCFCVKPS